ncbi:hypothetical protein D9757_007797 [Collybiopsis confluens]|uniref:Cytochrome P450 n=1 Tax=Collybiopsis confluens TaxID=2823264 RepID=A0A8H5HQS3_9AGAR|nr:hypothetical protein D9757_007797 [Collybiopsis confluens]
MLTTLILTGLLFIFVALLVWPNNSHNIPGPPGRPLLGNLLDIPKSNASENYLKLRAKYGDILHLSVFKQDIVVLNSQKAAMDILGGKADTSAGRPVLTMASELAGYGRFLALHQHTDRHRLGRTYLHGAIGPQHAREYASSQEEQVVRFLRKLLNEPEDFEEHYGHIASDAHDPYIEASSRVMQKFSEAAKPGKWLVDLIPLLKHIPSWFPGANFQSFAAECRTISLDAFQEPYLSIKQQIKEGTAKKSLVASFLETLGENA